MKSDSELVALARDDDRDAFGVLARRYQTLARRFAMRLVSRDMLAQDLAQEAVIQTYLSLERLRDPARFKSWLGGIVLNVCRSHIRDREVTCVSLEAMMEGRQFHAVPFSTCPSHQKRWPRSVNCTTLCWMPSQAVIAALYDI